MRHTLVTSLLLFALFTVPHPVLADESDLPREAAAALRKAVAFFRENVATEGGYLWRYSEDLETREGEGVADEFTVWLQPPGTPAIGMALLGAYWRTGDACYLDAATETGMCLVRGQLRSGGWDNSITFDPSRRPKNSYRVDVPTTIKSIRNTTTLDDDKTQSATRFLIHLDATLEFRDARIHECVLYALDSLVKAQFPNGAWPQRFSEAPDPAKFPITRAGYPDSWSRTSPSEKYSTFYTFNDNAIADVVDTMFLAARVYDETKYQEAAERAGDFILLAQMPEPQPAWAQQYDLDMHPSWARKFEPASVTGGESQGVIRTLLEIYRQTGKQKYLEPVPRALEYLKASELDNGQLARFYELKTNRPLYFTIDYQLTYSDADMPTHYAFKVTNKLESIERVYQETLALAPSKVGLKPYTRPKGSSRVTSSTIARVQQVLKGLDAQGRWVEDGRLNYHGDDDPTTRVIDCRTFTKNVDVLSDYLGAVTND